MSDTATPAPIPRTIDQFTDDEVFDNWNVWKQRQAQAQSVERTFRGEIVRRFFPKLNEGANNTDVTVHGETRKLTVTQPVERKVDEPLLAALVAEVTAQRERVRDGTINPEESRHPLFDVNFDKLIRKKPELATKEYRDLDAVQKPYFETVLVIKDGSPQVELKPAKT